MKLPTETAVALAETCDLHLVFNDIHQWKQALGHFQRMALVADYDTAVRAMMPHVQQKLTGQHKQVLTLIHDMVKQDVLGLAMESLLQVATSGRSEKDRVMASTVVNSLFGDKELLKDSVLTDKLVMNLVGSE